MASDVLQWEVKRLIDQVGEVLGKHGRQWELDVLGWWQGILQQKGTHLIDWVLEVIGDHGCLREQKIVD